MSNFSELKNLDRELIILAKAMNDAQSDYARRPCAQTQARFAEVQTRYKWHQKKWREAALKTLDHDGEEDGVQEED